MNLVDTIKWARNFAMLLVQMRSHHEALWCFIFVSFLGFGTLTIFLSTVAAALTIVFKSKVLLIPELWKHLKERGIGFFVSFTDVYVVSIWMRVIWLHHIVVVCLLWSLWAYCLKGGKTRVIKSRFVQVLNVSSSVTRLIQTSLSQLITGIVVYHSELNLLLCDTHALNNWSTSDQHV